MDSKTNSPSFTVSLRGYDRMEVDEYLDSLAEALGQVEQAEERCRGLQTHIDRLNSRIADLEERITRDTPRTGAVLGERIAILLRSAEETAADTMSRAEATALEMTEKAREEVAAAEDQARGAISRGEEQARRIDAAARAEAAEIIAEAEARASARTRQIERWAEQVVSHTRAEEARMLKEQQDLRQQAAAQLRDLADQRSAVAANMAEIRDVLGHALGLVGPPVELPDQSAPTPVAETGPTSPPVGGSGFSYDGDMAAADDAAAEPGPMELSETARDGAGRATDQGAPDQGVPHREATGLEAADREAMTRVATDPEATGPEGTAREVTAHDGAAHAAAAPVRAGQPTLTGTSLTVDDEDDDEMPWPAAFRPVDDLDERPEPDPTGEIEMVIVAGGEPKEADEFDTKFEAWVTGSEGPQHFRRL